MKAPIPIIVSDDDDVDVFALAAEAKDKQLIIITNGKRAVLARTVPPGWHKLGVAIKTPTRAELRPTPCAA